MAAVIRVAERVAEEVAEDLLQGVGIRIGQRTRALHREDNAALGRRGREVPIPRVSCDLRDIRGLDLRLPAARFEAGQVQQVIHDVLEPFGVVCDDGQEFPGIRGWQLAVQQRFRVAADGRERRLQLVAGVGDEVPPHLFQATQVRQVRQRDGHAPRHQRIRRHQQAPLVQGHLARLQAMLGHGLRQRLAQRRVPDQGAQRLPRRRLGQREHRAGRRVGPHEPAVRRHVQDPLRHGVHEGLELLPLPGGRRQAIRVVLPQLVHGPERAVHFGERRTFRTRRPGLVRVQCPVAHPVQRLREHARQQPRHQPAGTGGQHAPEQKGPMQPIGVLRRPTFRQDRKRRGDEPRSGEHRHDQRQQDRQPDAREPHPSPSPRNRYPKPRTVSM
ncbi:MAG: hypothetical protein P8174_05165 [Gemmatimonadota bacterium]